ncbi:ABC transporter ATP-binding protein [Natronobiforma cellulositropha]|uniref:ABC transporter ATP-binding protein n=1 Tax=Natronobiforma cellulositropha TaxID=1679076 RepID=UPI0021D56E03|nr:ABC transporter ATP-binding protein [Natronobiforma cellulositropha]
MTDDSLLSIRDLRAQFHTDEGVVRAVDGVSFDVGRGETVCLVGESGSGKTVTAESITRLLATPPGRIVGGEIRFDGTDVTSMAEDELRTIRGSRIAHVFQNPQGSLNPVYSVGAQIGEAIRAHRRVSRRHARARAIDLLESVGIPDPAARVDDYPHEFSTGQKQRVAIAMALACDPDLLIADEPTTALDVTVQADILDLLASLQAERGMSILLVTHDLGVVARLADRVVVLYAGTVLERADVVDLFERPAHPYTRALLECLPGVDGEVEPIGGTLPSPIDPPDGCRFAPRCPHAIEECHAGGRPPPSTVGDDHVASCLGYHREYRGAIDLERHPTAEETQRVSDRPDAGIDGGGPR